MSSALLSRLPTENADFAQVVVDWGKPPEPNQPQDLNPTRGLTPGRPSKATTGTDTVIFSPLSFLILTPLFPATSHVL